MNGDIFEYQNYKYSYHDENYWRVQALQSDDSYEGTEILSVVNGIPVKKLLNLFFQNKSISKSPSLPGEAIDMDYSFYECSNLEEAPSIPETMKTMQSSFIRCYSLTKAPTIPKNVESLQNTFYNCNNLSGGIEINATPKHYRGCLYETNIEYVSGSCEYSVKRKILETRKRLFPPTIELNDNQNLFIHSKDVSIDYYNIFCDGELLLQSEREKVGDVTIINLPSVQNILEKSTGTHKIHVCALGDGYNAPSEASNEVDLIIKEFSLVPNVKFGWSKKIYESPETLLFWIDFLETSGSIEKYSVDAFGPRPKIESKNDIKAIYYKETPNIIFKEPDDEIGQQTGYRYFNAPDMLNMFKSSGQGRSAKEEIDSLLYKHSYCTESLNLTTLPIFYLEPNCRIYINDPLNGIEGEYTVNKISQQLNYDGKTTLTAVKVPERII